MPGLPQGTSLARKESWDESWSWSAIEDGVVEGVKFRFAFAPCIASVAILSLTCVVVSCLVVGLCDTS